MEYNRNNEKVIYDINLDGGTNSKGNIEELYDSDAIANGLKLWLLSNRGDFIGDSRKGGVLIDYIDKPMNISNQAALKYALQKGLSDDWPEIIPVSLEVNPNYEKGCWDIRLIGYTATQKIGFSINEKLKALQ